MMQSMAASGTKAALKLMDDRRCVGIFFAHGHPQEKWKAGQSVPVATRRSAPPWTESKGLREAFLRRAVGRLWPGSTMGSKRYDEPHSNN